MARPGIVEILLADGSTRVTFNLYQAAEKLFGEIGIGLSGSNLSPGLCYFLGAGAILKPQQGLLLGGDLGFESVPHEGSTFWFVLPVEVLDEPTAVGGDVALAGDAERPGVVRVMVVE